MHWLAKDIRVRHQQNLLPTVMMGGEEERRKWRGGGAFQTNQVVSEGHTSTLTGRMLIRATQLQQSSVPGDPGHSHWNDMKAFKTSKERRV